MQGDNLAPLSHRDMWILKRASRLAKHVPQLSNPTYDRWQRHVHDWLRKRLRNELEGAEGDPLPHWAHSWDPEYSESGSDYTSDEDESASDEDAPDSDYCGYQCPYCPTRRHPNAELCNC